MSPLRYGMYSRMAGTGCASASSGNQMRAARRQPSGMGIQTCSSSRTALGQSVLVCIHISLNDIANEQKRERTGLSLNTL